MESEYLIYLGNYLLVLCPNKISFQGIQVLYMKFKQIQIFVII